MEKLVSSDEQVFELNKEVAARVRALIRDMEANKVTAEALGEWARSKLPSRVVRSFSNLKSSSSPSSSGSNAGDLERVNVDGASLMYFTMLAAMAR